MEKEMIIYNEFDPKAGGFKPISKEDRDKKEVELRAKITIIEQEQEKERQELEAIQNKMQGCQKNLFAELMAQNQESDEEVFS